MKSKSSPHRPTIRSYKIMATLFAVMFCLGTAMADPNRLVTGKRILLPPLGNQQNVGSLPMNIVLSPDAKFGITSDMGFRQSLWSINSKTGIGISHVDFPNDSNSTNGLYYGLAFGDGGLLYVAQGANDSIAVLSLSKA